MGEGAFGEIFRQPLCLNMEIKLRALKEEDTPNIVAWRNRPEVKENLYSQEDITTEGHLDYFHKMIETKKGYQFVIEIVETGKAIGTTFIKNIDYENRSGEFGIFIGETDFYGKGIGQHVAKEVLRFAFEKLELNKVWLTVFADNTRAIRCYLKVGFKKCAYYRDEILRDGRYYDVVGMEFLKKDWI